MDKRILWAPVVNNCVSVIGWIVLAIFFEKWWIALFSIFFVSWKVKTKTHMICDGCGRYSPYAETHGEAIEKELQVGWIRRRSQGGDWEDFCPDCQAKMGSKAEFIAYTD